MEEIYLVFLHGWGGTIKSLEKLSNELKNINDSLEYKHLILEMPGHGETKQMSAPWNMERFSKWLSEELGTRKIQRYILIGHSFGGKIILNGVINNILDPEKIILIDSNGIKPNNNLKKSFWKIASKVYKLIDKLPFSYKLRNFIYTYIIREKDYLKTNEMVRESFKLFNEQHYDDGLENIKIDTLIIWGKEDMVTPLWMGEKLHAHISNSKFEVVTGTHGLPLKNPEKIAPLINKFIKND